MIQSKNRYQTKLNILFTAPLKRGLILFVFLVVIQINGIAQQYTSGDVVANFRLPEAGTDSIFHLKEIVDVSAVVLVFFGNECPYAKLYQERLLKLYERYSSSGTVFLVINSFDDKEYPDESVDSMKVLWDTLSMPMPYLADKRGNVARDYDVKRVPETFVLSPDNEGHFMLRYRGAIDDNPQLAEDTHQDYLEDAIKAVLNNKAPQKPFVRPVGCNLR